MPSGDRRPKQTDAWLTAIQESLEESKRVREDDEATAKKRTQQQIGRMSRRKGAAFERKIAKKFGGQRAPYSGAIGGGDLWGPFSKYFTFELKKGAQVPVFFEKAYKQAVDDARGGRIPAVVHERDRGPDLVTLSADDFATILEAVMEVWDGQGQP